MKKTVFLILPVLLLSLMLAGCHAADATVLAPDDFTKPDGFAYLDLDWGTAPDRVEKALGYAIGEVQGHVSGHEDGTEHAQYYIVDTVHYNDHPANVTVEFHDGGLCGYNLQFVGLDRETCDSIYNDFCSTFKEAFGQPAEDRTETREEKVINEQTVVAAHDFTLTRWESTDGEGRPTALTLQRVDRAEQSVLTVGVSWNCYTE